MWEHGQKQALIEREVTLSKISITDRLTGGMME
jgi:hypothetical protein